QTEGLAPFHQRHVVGCGSVEHLTGGEVDKANGLELPTGGSDAERAPPGLRAVDFHDLVNGGAVLDGFHHETPSSQAQLGRRSGYRQEGNIDGPRIRGEDGYGRTPLGLQAGRYPAWNPAAGGGFREGSGLFGRQRIEYQVIFLLGKISIAGEFLELGNFFPNVQARIDAFHFAKPVQSILEGEPGKGEVERKGIGNQIPAFLYLYGIGFQR